MSGIVHYLIYTEAGHWMMYATLSVAIGSLLAPTKQSSPFYVWFFRFSNGIIALNPQRALNTRIESSPNWKDAVDQHLQNLEKEGSGDKQTVG